MKKNNQKVEIIVCKKIEPTSIEKLTRHFLSSIVVCKYFTSIKLSKLGKELDKDILRKLKTTGTIKISAEKWNINQIKINEEYTYIILRLNAKVN